MNKITSAPGLRYGIVGLLVLLMLIPLAFVQGVADERQSYYHSVVDDVAASWGEPLVLSGPFLVVPESFRYTGHNRQGEEIQRTGMRKRVYLPESLTINGDIEHQYRYRSIYQVPVYQVVNQLQGRFKVPSPSDQGVQLLLSQAQLVVGLSHTRSIEEMSTLVWSGQQIEFQSSSAANGLPDGVHATVPDIAADEAVEFAFDFSAKGTQQYAFVPLGAATEVKLKSSWPHPSFSGAYLPAQYTITDDGFDASWKVHKLARVLPSSWILSSEPLDLSQSIASISLFEPTTTYSIIDRGLKYAILFIGLTFLTFVCFELLVPVQFHYMQYVVIGAALVLFYQTLLSLSEHIDFAWAYVCATLLLTALIAWYVFMMTRRASIVLWTSAILLLLYSCLYTLLQLQAYALLVGTSVLIIGLAALMYATRGLSRADD